MVWKNLKNVAKEKKNTNKKNKTELKHKTKRLGRKKGETWKTPLIFFMLQVANHFSVWVLRGVIESSGEKKGEPHNRGTLHQRRVPEENHIFRNERARFSGSRPLALGNQSTFFPSYKRTITKPRVYFAPSRNSSGKVVAKEKETVEKKIGCFVFPWWVISWRPPRILELIRDRRRRGTINPVRRVGLNKKCCAQKWWR